jgi:hypothetical protein
LPVDRLGFRVKLYYGFQVSGLAYNIIKVFSFIDDGKSLFTVHRLAL